MPDCVSETTEWQDCNLEINNNHCCNVTLTHFKIKVRRKATQLALLNRDIRKQKSHNLKHKWNDILKQWFIHKEGNHIPAPQIVQSSSATKFFLSWFSNEWHVEEHMSTVDIFIHNEDNILTFIMLFRIEGLTNQKIVTWREKNWYRISYFHSDSIMFYHIKHPLENLSWYSYF